jgi:hypothetical protein
MAKFYEVAAFLFVLNLSVSLFAGGDLFTNGLPGDQASPTGTNWTYDPENGTYYLAYDPELLSAADGFESYEVSGFDAFDLLGILGMFISAILNATIFLPFFLMGLSIPAQWAALITAPCWFVYGAGIMQIVLNRTLESMS